MACSEEMREIAKKAFERSNYFDTRRSWNCCYISLVKQNWFRVGRFSSYREKKVVIWEKFNFCVFVVELKQNTGDTGIIR